MTRKRRHASRGPQQGQSAAPPRDGQQPSHQTHQPGTNGTPHPQHQANQVQAQPQANQAHPKKRRRHKPHGATENPAITHERQAMRTGAKPLRGPIPHGSAATLPPDDEAPTESVQFIPHSPSSVPPTPSLRHQTLEFGEYSDFADSADEEEDDDEDGDEQTPTARRPRPEEPELVAAQIRELEAHLDAMIDQASTHVLPNVDDDDDDELRGGPGSNSDDSDPAPTVTSLGTGHSVRNVAGGPETEPTVFDTARELLSTDFYLRKWGRLGMRNRSEEIDDFGYDPVYDSKVRPLFDFLYDRYFRVETIGAGNIPAEGRCLLVANHSGTLPYDGAMIKTAVKREHPQHRDVRWLAEDFIFHFPFLGSFTNRIGAVRACQENAERLLRQEALVAVFPEGVKGIGKLYRDRYRLQRFGRGGFVKLCLRTNTPIVPVVVVGAEEANPMLLRVEYFARALGLPYIPVTPTFPLLGPAGLAPAPTKWKIIFGDLLDVASYGPEAADDELLVGRLAERVRTTIQDMLDKALGERKSVFFG
ncbi:1-acyl-sn-glycerol-3-phosphate acyltransferase [Pendulispora rubella]|uniref:1-acyl-sn-glycerol-3-phosphate acyltransferase n=1 Tax=Pendulispora rubella TaxID=2741070 RepID=A0ABZ2LCW7_9BACT